MSDEDVKLRVTHDLVSEWSRLRLGVEKILKDQACVEGWDWNERICTHPDHGDFMWVEGSDQCNGASELLPELRKLLP